MNKHVVNVTVSEIQALFHRSIERTKVELDCSKAYIYSWECGFVTLQIGQAQADCLKVTFHCSQALPVCWICHLMLELVTYINVEIRVQNLAWQCYTSSLDKACMLCCKGDSSPLGLCCKYVRFLVLLQTKFIKQCKRRCNDFRVLTINTICFNTSITTWKYLTISMHKLWIACGAQPYAKNVNSFVARQSLQSFTITLGKSLQKQDIGRFQKCLFLEQHSNPSTCLSKTLPTFPTRNRDARIP